MGTLSAGFGDVACEYVSAYRGQQPAGVDAIAPP